MLNDSNETLKEMSDRLASTRESRRSGKGRSSFGKSQEPERHSEQNDPLKQRYMNLRPERQTSKSVREYARRSKCVLEGFVGPF